MERIPVAAAAAVLLSLVALLVYAGQPARPSEGGVVIHYKWTKTDPGTGESFVGSRTTYFNPATGEYRNVKQAPGRPAAEQGFTRDLGGVSLGRKEDGAEFLRVNPQLPKTAGVPVARDERSLRGDRQFAGTVEVLGQTAFTIRSTVEENGVTYTVYEESLLPGLAFPVKIVWLHNNVPYETFEAVRIERRPLGRDDTMARYAHLPRE